MFKRKPYVGLSDKIRNQKNSQQILLESSSWLTIGNIVSRLLGALKQVGACSKVRCSL